MERLQIVQPHRLDGDAHDLLLRDAHRAVLLAQEILARLDQRPLRHETHDLGARHAHAARIGLAAHLVEGDVQGRRGDIRDVHRDLCDAVLLDEPPDGLRGLERAGLHDGIALGILHDLARDGIALAHGASLLAHVKRNGVGTARGGRIEVEVHGNQEIARADGRGTRACDTLVVGTRPEVGRRLLVCKLLGQRLVLAGTADGQVAPLGREGGRLVAIGRDVQFVGDALGQLARQRGALLERDARDGDQRQHVGGAHAGVRPLVFAHVDQLGGPLHALERRLDDRLGRPDEGYDRAVGRLARIDVEQLDPSGSLDRLGNLRNDMLVAALTEVGDTLYDSFFHRIGRLLDFTASNIAKIRNKT